MAGQNAAGAAQEEPGTEPPDPVLAGLACCPDTAAPSQRPKSIVPPAAWSSALPSNRPVLRVPSPHRPHTGIAHQAAGGQQGVLQDSPVLAGPHQGAQHDTLLPVPAAGCHHTAAHDSGLSRTMAGQAMDTALRDRNTWQPQLPLTGLGKLRSGQSMGSDSNRKSSRGTAEPHISGVLAKPIIKRIKRGGFVPPRKA